MIGCVRGLTGSEGVLVGGVRGALSSGDSGLGALVGVHDVAVIGGGLGVEIVGLIDDWSGLRANVVLGRTTNSKCNDEALAMATVKADFIFCVLGVVELMGSFSWLEVLQHKSCMQSGCQRILRCKPFL